MKIVIASHGNLAEGMLDSLQMIIGNCNHISTLNAYTEENVDYSKKIENIIKNHNYKKEELLVLTDLLGGSVNTEFMNYIKKYPFYLVSGFNLAMVLEFALLSEIDLSVIQEVVEKSSYTMSVGNNYATEVVDEEF